MYLYILLPETQYSVNRININIRNWVIFPKQNDKYKKINRLNGETRNDYLKNKNINKWPIEYEMFLFLKLLTLKYQSSHHIAINLTHVCGVEWNTFQTYFGFVISAVKNKHKLCIFVPRILITKFCAELTSWLSYPHEIPMKATINVIRTLWCERY